MNATLSGLHVFVDIDEKTHIKTTQEDVHSYNEEDIPECEGLLPPLPDSNDALNSPVFLDDSTESSLHSRTQSLEGIIIPLNRTRTSSNKIISTPATPKASDFHKSSEVQTPGSAITFSGVSTPSKEKSNEDLYYSPTITIDERFEVSVDIPSEEAIPKTIEEKIKFYQNFQMKEAQEFDKTLSSLKKGGWLSFKDLSSLEIKKQNHFKKWEDKINELKNSLKNKKQNDPIHEFGNYFSPKLRNFDHEHVDGDKSPNLQTLERQFSVLGISR